jgi:hypothetical protein
MVGILGAILLISQTVTKKENAVNEDAGIRANWLAGLAGQE